MRINQNLQPQSQPPMFGQELTWVCPQCKRERPDHAISVVKHDFSKELDLESGSFIIHVKYCNDNGECASKAFDRELQTPAHIKAKQHIQQQPQDESKQIQQQQQSEAGGHI